MTLLILLISLLASPHELTVKVTNIKKPHGQLMVAVYSSEDDYMNDEKALVKQVVPVTQTGSISFTLPLPQGEYAIAIFHDANGDEKLNTNLVGIPTEKFGFSNNVWGTFGPPSFEDATFTLSEDHLIQISLGKP